MAYLLVLVLLQITRGHQAFWVDIGGDWLNELRVRVHVLHLEEGQNVLDLQVIRAVGHGLPFGGQATGSHPVGVLFLLQKESQTLTIKNLSKGQEMIINVALTSVLPCHTGARSHSCHRPQGLAT